MNGRHIRPWWSRLADRRRRRHDTSNEAAKPEAVKAWGDRWETQRRRW